MKHNLIALILALGIVSWAQTARKVYLPLPRKAPLPWTPRHVRAATKPGLLRRKIATRAVRITPWLPRTKKKRVAVPGKIKRPAAAARMGSPASALATRRRLLRAAVERSAPRNAKRAAARARTVKRRQATAAGIALGMRSGSQRRVEPFRHPQEPQPNGWGLGWRGHMSLAVEA